MASGAFWGYGTQLKLGDGAGSEAFTAIAELSEIVPPKMKRGSSDVTSHQSADGYAEWLPNMRDGGEVSAKGNWLPNNSTQDETTGVLECFNDDVNHNWQLVLPGGLGTFTFAGHVTAFEPETPLTNHSKLSFTIKISGKPLFT